MIYEHLSGVVGERFSWVLFLHTCAFIPSYASTFFLFHVDVMPLISFSQKKPLNVLRYFIRCKLYLLSRTLPLSPLPTPHPLFILAV